MLAHHYLRALELAGAAGLDAAALGVSARHALRDAGDRAAALCAVDAAERFYTAALELWPRDDPERTDLMLRRAVPVRTVGAGDPALLTDVRDAFLEAGDRVRAGEAEMLLSDSFWIQGRGDLADEHAERAAALLSGAPPSRASAWVLVRRATRAVLAGDTAAGVELGSQVRDLAEQLGWVEGQIDALGLLAIARIEIGDRGGLDDAARARARVVGRCPRLARERLQQPGGRPADPRRPRRRLGPAWRGRGRRPARLAPGAALVRERCSSTTATAEASGTRRSGRPTSSRRRSRPARLTTSPGSSTPFEPRSALARDDLAGAVADAERSPAAARSVADPQAAYFVLAACAYVFTLASEHGRELRSPASSWRRCARLGWGCSSR